MSEVTVELGFVSPEYVASVMENARRQAKRIERLESYLREIERVARDCVGKGR